MNALTPSPRERIRDRFTEARRRGDFLVGAAIGAGILGQAAERGGADFILALNAGRFRIMGAASVTAMLPIRDANAFVASFAPIELLSQCSVPVYFGASILDSSIVIDDLVRRIADLGFAGITNFPSLAHYPAPVQAAFDDAGIGFSKELALFDAAHAHGLSTLAYVKTGGQARAVAGRGVDVICYNFGWSAGGPECLASDISVEEAAFHAREIARIVVRANPECFFVLEGGPIEDPDRLATICRVAPVQGYIGGSTIDRVPLAESVASQIVRFKSAARLARVLNNEERGLIAFGQGIGLAGRSEAMIEVFEAIRRFGDTDASMLVSGAQGTGRQTAIDAIHNLWAREPGALAVIEVAAASPQQAMSALFGRGPELGHAAQVGLAARDGIASIVLRGLERLPRRMQARIANAMQRRRFTPIGGRRSLPWKKRLFFVADGSLASLMGEGTIDPLLVRQLEEHEIHLPALSDRLEDIEDLLNGILDRMAGEAGKRPLLSPAAMGRLRRHDWAGNLHEMRVFAARLLAHHTGGRVDEETANRLLDGETSRGRRRLSSERDVILDALWRHGFHRAETASFLGISRKTLYNKIKRYGLTAHS